MWVIGSFSYIFSALIFFYFIATGYRIQRTQEFVSLSKSDGECSDVALTVEGSFLATDSGIWEGFESFNYHKATYFIHLSQYKETDATFWQQMNEIVLPQLHYMAANASDRNTVDNLMLWMTWTASLRPHIEGDLNFFSMTGMCTNKCDCLFMHSPICALACFQRRHWNCDESWVFFWYHQWTQRSVLH